jgi:hypothetical protein
MVGRLIAAAAEYSVLRTQYPGPTPDIELFSPTHSLSHSAYAFPASTSFGVNSPRSNAVKFPIVTRAISSSAALVKNA